MTPKSARCEGPRVILAPIVFFSWENGLQATAATEPKIGLAQTQN